MGSFLTWLQEKTAPVFVVLTANDVTPLLPEFLRKGRTDEMFFVDLPGKTERQAIWAIQIRKYGRDPAKFDVQALAKATEGLTGAEIEQAFIDALYAAFAEGREPTTLAVSLALNELVPLSRLMGEQLQALRTWAKGRARPATTPAEVLSGRKLAA